MISIQQRLANIPQELKNLDQWLNWKLTPDGRKVPLGKVNDPHTFKTFAEVIAIDPEHIGYVFTENDDVVGIDLDKARNKENNELTLTSLQFLVLTQFSGAYIERSPSGTGFHILGWFPGKKKNFPRKPSGQMESLGSNGQRVECYASGRYFTMTGDQLNNWAVKDKKGKVFIFKSNPEPFTFDVSALVVKMFQDVKPRIKENNLPVEQHDKPPAEKVREALKYLDPDCSYEAWLQTGMGLHDWDSVLGLALWEEWSATATVKYVTGLTESKWSSFTPGTGTTIGTVFSQAIKRGFKGLRHTPSEDFTPASDDPALMPVPEKKKRKQYKQTKSDTLMGEKVEPTNWWVENLLPSNGVLLVGARPKTGKSMMILQLITGAASEGDFLGNKYGKPRRILYYDLESSENRARRRLHQIRDWLPQKGQGNDIIFQFDADQGQLGIDRLKEELAKGEIGVVVIDTLQKFRGLADSKNRSVYAEDYEFVTSLLNVAREHNVLLILVHHTKKGSAVIEHGVDSMSGSSGLTGAVDTIWLLERLKGFGKGHFLLDVHGRDVEQRYLHVACDWELFGWQFVEEVDEPWELLAKNKATDLSEVKAENREEEVLRVLREAQQEWEESVSQTKAGDGLPQEKRAKKGKNAVSQTVSQTVSQAGLGYRELNKAMGLSPTQWKLKALLEELIQTGKVKKIGAKYQWVEPKDAVLE